MNRPSLNFLNFFIFYAIAITFACLQSTVFHWMFNWHGTFQLVIVLITYITVYRRPTEGLIFVALTSYTLGLLSSMMESVAMFTLLALYFFIRLVRARVYASGPSYFSWLTAGAILVFHVINQTVASLFEINPPKIPFFTSWIIETALTFLTMRICYAFFYWIDVKTNRDHELELAG